MGKLKKGNVQQGGKLADPKIHKGPLKAQKKGGVQNGVNKVNPKKHTAKLPENIKKKVRNEKHKKNILEKANLDEIVTIKGPVKKNQKAKLPPANVQNGTPENIKKQVKNENHKKNILEKANLDEIVTVKGPINKNKKAKLLPASVQSGTPANTKKQLKNKKLNNILEKKNLDEIVTVKGRVKKNQKAKLPPAGVQSGKDNGDKKELQNKNPQIKLTNNIPASKPQNNKKKAGPEKNLKPQLGLAPKLPVPSSSPTNKQKHIPLAKKEPVISPNVAAKEKPKKKSKEQVVESPKEEEVEDGDQDLEEAFDEAKFNEILKEETVIKIVEALKKHLASGGLKKNQIFSDYRYILDVICFKIPYCPIRIVRLNVKHPVRTDDDEVCLIVKDLKRGMRVDYEPTVHYYEDLLQKEGVKGIKTIMPFNQLKKEYGSYEMKAKLANTYDYFLCDGAIVGHVVGFLGNKFRNSRCAPYAVRFTTKYLAGEIEKALHKTCYKQGAKGCMISIPVGHHKMSAKSVAENILEVISQLKEVYPGGLPNIRNMFVRTNLKGASMPLYASLVAPKKTPFVVGPKEARMKKLKEAANKILEQFDVTLSGDILRKRKVEKNNEDIEEEPKMKKKKEKKSDKKNKESLKEKLLKKLNSQLDGHGSEEEDVEEAGVDEDEKESVEEQNVEEDSDKQGSEEEEDEERNMIEGSDEDGSDIDEDGSDIDEDGSDIDENESDEEESDTLEFNSEDFDSDDETTGDIGAPTNDSDEDSDEDDDEE